MSDTYPPVPTKLMTGGGSTGQATDPPYYPPTPDKITVPSSPSGGGPGNSGSGFHRRAFIKAYANLTARAWMDEAYLELILASPVETLERAGISTVPGAVVRVIQHKITGSGKIEDQVDAWIKGNETGLYELYLPMRPDDIDIPEGGAVALGDIGCCCCPCCCCT